MLNFHEVNLCRPDGGGSHTMEPYSRTERTRAMYAVLLLLIGQWCKLCLKKPIVEFTFSMTVDICECYLRSS